MRWGYLGAISWGALLAGELAGAPKQEGACGDRGLCLGRTFLRVSRTSCGDIQTQVV